MLLGEPVNYGSFRGVNRKLLMQFVNDGALDYITIGSQQKKVRCADGQNLRSYLHHKFEIPSLDNYISFYEKEETTRGEAVKATSDSKFRKIKVLEGFLVNSFEKIDAHLNGRRLRLVPEQGTFTFIHDFQNFVIPEDVTVVGVEGHENFKTIASQRHLFAGLKALFLWRYQNSTSIARWLNLIPNPYLHFGDVDPKGLHIYISEFRNKIGANRCKFLIPEDLDALMFTSGKSELYNDQIERLKEFDFDSVPEIAEALRIIRKYRKGLAQEALIP
jgi:hypothetical protein